MLVVLASLVALFLAPAASQETTVKVGFYGEALCPDCINFINGPLTHAFKEVSWCSLIRRLNLPRILQVPNIFTLHYAPWGNAKLVDDKFECQHGPMECTMNTVEACALNYYPNM
jgi:interferon gamma-inducible protein 30